MKKPVWIVTITVRGPKPDMKVLCGDTMYATFPGSKTVSFLRMEDGQSARFTLKRQKEKR